MTYIKCMWTCFISENRFPGFRFRLWNQTLNQNQLQNPAEDSKTETKAAAKFHDASRFANTQFS